MHLRVCHSFESMFISCREGVIIIKYKGYEIKNKKLVFILSLMSPVQHSSHFFLDAFPKWHNRFLAELFTHNFSLNIHLSKVQNVTEEIFLF